MIGDLLWRVVEARLARRVPAAHFRSTMGDLAEDYADRRARIGPIRAGLWLIAEARSLARAYRAGRAPPGFAPARTRLALVADLHHAWRRAVARPSVAVLCASLLALGIGLATAMFSVVDSLLLQPAPFKDADRLIEQRLWRPEPAVMDAWRSTGMFDAVEAASPAALESDGSGADAWPQAFVTPGIFDMLGVRPLRGRLFTSGDGRSVQAGEIILSETIWRSAFGGDPDLPGRRITLAGSAVIVVGIMPGSFRFPAPTTVLWRPLDLSHTQYGTAIYGRLKPGVPRADAEARVAGLARLIGHLPERYGGTPPVSVVGRPALSDFTRRAVWLLLAGVGLVFVVLCANVASLLLAGLTARQREFAMCVALGASRGRLIRQAVIEHTLVALAGAAAGIGVAWVLTSMVPPLLEGRTLNPIDVDIRALAIASGLGVASVLLSGLVPAWLGTRPKPAGSLRGSRQAGTETRPSRLATRALLVSEIALACSLLAGSTLLVRSFVNLMHANRGLTLDGVVRVDLSQLDDAFRSPAAMALGTTAIETNVAAWPEISAVALSREIPPHGRVVRVGAGAVNSPDSAAGIAVDRYRVSAAFFAMYGIPIVRGRHFQPADTEQDVIVGERLASLLWPGTDPVGQTFVVGSAPARRVVGVAGEIRLPSLDPDLDRPEYYTPMGNTSRTVFLNLRCHSACPDEGTIRTRLALVHPVIGARVVRPSDDPYRHELSLPRAIAQAGGLFAIVAVLTAAGGLFTVLTCAVGRRRREFGIRSALGASPSDIRRLVLHDGGRVVFSGVAAGLVGGWIVARSLSAFHYGVTVADPATWTGVTALIALTSFAAAWRPARTAMRLDPVTLLREE